MDQQELVDQWVALDEQIKALTRTKEALEKALGDHKPGTELEGHTKRVRVQARSVLKPDQLEQRLAPGLWRRITKRVPVADLLKAEIKRGKISQDIVDECSVNSKTWFKTII
jgi:hypothetical protein